jgi:hypothetical protein
LKIYYVGIWKLSYLPRIILIIPSTYRIPQNVIILNSVLRLSWCSCSEQLDFTSPSQRQSLIGVLSPYPFPVILAGLVIRFLIYSAEALARLSDSDRLVLAEDLQSVCDPSVFASDKPANSNWRQYHEVISNIISSKRLGFIQPKNLKKSWVN